MCENRKFEMKCPLHKLLIIGTILGVELQFASASSVDCGHSVGGPSNNDCPRMVEDDWIYSCLSKNMDCQSPNIYHCAKNETGVWTEVCAPQEMCEEGKEPFVTKAGYVVCRFCNDPETYNTYAKLSNKFSYCPQQKTKCSRVKDGKRLIRCEDLKDTDRYAKNRRCRCNYEDDYIPLYYDFKIYNWTCTSFSEDLECYLSPCENASDGRKQKRGPDYHCYPVSSDVGIPSTPCCQVSSHVGKPSTLSKSFSGITGKPEVSIGTPSSVILIETSTLQTTENVTKAEEQDVGLNLVLVIAITVALTVAVSLFTAIIIYCVIKRCRSPARSEQQPQEQNEMQVLNSQEGNRHQDHAGNGQIQNNDGGQQQGAVPFPTNPDSGEDDGLSPLMPSGSSRQQGLETSSLNSPQSVNYTSLSQTAHRYHRSQGLGSTCTSNSVDSSNIETRPLCSSDISSKSQSTHARNVLSESCPSASADIENENSRLLEGEKGELVPEHERHGDVEEKVAIKDMKKLQKIYKEVLHKLVVTIKTDMDGEAVLNGLIKYDLGNKTTHMKIEDTQRRYEKNSEIYNLVERSGYEAYEIFKKILVETNHKALIKRIKDKENELLQAEGDTSSEDDLNNVDDLENKDSAV